MKWFFLVFLICSNVWAKNHMLILGGGGEPRNAPKTMFDLDLSLVGDFKKKAPHWETSLVFNGGHSETEKIAGQYFGTYNPVGQTFTTANYNKLLDAYEKKLLSGELKSGDQLMVHINTHGATRNPELEMTHQIATAEGALSNYNNVGTSVVSLDKLKKIAELAQQKGVKLAVIDLSCHSGNTLNLAKQYPGTCVISSTGPEHYAYGGGIANFAGRFNAALAPGRNLEEVFLEARVNYADFGFPMISSPQGGDVQSRLYEAISPYLYYYNPNSDKQTAFLEREIKDTNHCAPENHLAALIREVENLLKVADGGESERTLREFHAGVVNYYDYLAKLRADMRKARFDVALKETEFCTEIKANPLKKIKHEQSCVKYNGTQLATLEFDRMQDYFKGQSTKLKGQDAAQAAATAANIENAKKRRSQLLEQYPELAEIQDFWKKYPMRQQETHVLAVEVGLAQRKVYDMLYKRSTATGANPCRDFKL